MFHVFNNSFLYQQPTYFKHYHFHFCWSFTYHRCFISINTSLLRLLRAFLIGLYSKAVKGGDCGSTLRPADDIRFSVCTFNQREHLVFICLGALISRCTKLVVANCHLLAFLLCRVEHDYIAEIVRIGIATQDSNLCVINRCDCGLLAWG